MCAATASCSQNLFKLRHCVPVCAGVNVQLILKHKAFIQHRG
uniref:Uncharacterized protein n=1 Tax=Anopheles gambiae TaxID=7165 RepID=A0ABK8G874_ANOGA